MKEAQFKVYFRRLLGHGYSLVEMEVRQEKPGNESLGGTGSTGRTPVCDLLWCTVGAKQAKQTIMAILFERTAPSAQLITRCIDTASPFPPCGPSAG